MTNNLLIVIPARGGSKGIPKKNIYPLNGVPLINYTLKVIRDSGVNADVAISTDSDEIAEIARVEMPEIFIVKRPKEISGDTASTESALIYTLGEMEKMTGNEYVDVMTLQPTSPFRKAVTLREFYQEYLRCKGEYDAQLTLTEDRSDFWIQKSDGGFERLQKDAPRRRQDRKPLYVENSSIYITDKAALLNTKLVLGTHANGYIIDEDESLDINNPIDIMVAEAIINLKKDKNT